MNVEQIKELRAKTHFGMSDCKNALQDAEGDMDKAIAILQTKGLKKIDALFEAVEGEVRAHSFGNKGVIVEVNCQTDFAARSEPFQKFLNSLFDGRQLGFIAAPEVAEEQKQLSAVLREVVRMRRVERLSSPDGFVTAYNHPGGKISVLVSFLKKKDAIDADLQEVADHVAMHIAAVNPKYVLRVDIPVDLVTKQKEFFKQELIAENVAKASPKVLNETMVEKIVDGKMNKWFGESVLMEQESVITAKKTIAQVVASAPGLDVVLEFHRFERGEKTN